MTSKQSFLRTLVLFMSVALLAVLPASTGLAQQKMTKPMASPTMSQFLVIAPHTPEQCLATLDAVAAKPNGKAELAKWDWGCGAGDHTGYLIVTAASAAEALKSVPEAERGTARALKLNKFTPEQIKSFHEMKK